MRSKFPVAVHMFFLQDDQVLLLRRFNTLTKISFTPDGRFLVTLAEDGVIRKWGVP